jgi:hypothetical protein
MCLTPEKLLNGVGLTGASPDCRITYNEVCDTETIWQSLWVKKCANQINILEKSKCRSPGGGCLHIRLVQEPAGSLTSPTGFAANGGKFLYFQEEVV